MFGTQLRETVFGDALQKLAELRRKFYEAQKAFFDIVTVSMHGVIQTTCPEIQVSLRFSLPEPRQQCARHTVVKPARNQNHVIQQQRNSAFLEFYF